MRHLSPLIVFAAAPVAAVAITTAAMLAMAAAGRHPLWHVQMITLSEAAASRDVATVVWLIERGRDPNHRYPVRRGILNGDVPAAMTPIEAAVEARRADVVDLLLRNGARLDEAQRVALACRAKRRGDEDLIRYFEARGAVTCDNLESR
jgi:hypothetical protein